MAGFPDVIGSTRFFPQPLVTSKIDPSFKIDEGYSEDARSQDDPDSPMKLESAMADAFQPSWSFAAGFQDQILALNEVERSGIFHVLAPRLVWIAY